MTNQERQKITAGKNFYFNRYLLLRYLLAVFFFANLYWLLAAIASHSALRLLPLILLLLAVLAIIEYVKIYGTQSTVGIEKLWWNKFFYTSQLSVNLFLLFGCSYHSLFSFIFPFLENTVMTRTTLAAWIGIGIVFAAMSLKRISKIQKKKDSYYGYIKEYQKLIEGE